jgi:nitrogen fixation/metabolism regulation signal transduction histidine kinase
MNRSTGEILTVMKGKLGVETGQLSLANLRSERYFKTSIEWEAYGQILEAMEIHIGSIMVNISDWENRERDRQQERPRWTKGDERKYRREINKNLVLCRRKTQELKGHQTTVRSLRASLTTTQERIRNELGLRGNENIRYFTYVTVIFLPLGFAASIFSMQAAPQHQTLRQMIVVAVVGIIVTILVLVVIQSLFSLLEESVDRLTAQGKRLANRFRGSEKENKDKTDGKDNSEAEPKYNSPDVV